MIAKAQLNSFYISTCYDYSLSHSQPVLEIKGDIRQSITLFTDDNDKEMSKVYTYSC